MAVPDNGPLIVGITWMLTFLCGGFLGLRIYAKLSRRQGLWWDDHILIASWVGGLQTRTHPHTDLEPDPTPRRSNHNTNGPIAWIR